jgi:arylsulfatase A-like enzyme
LAEVPRDAGYATAIFGKWHLGALEQYKASLAKHPKPAGSKHDAVLSDQLSKFTHVQDDSGGALRWGR